MPASRCDSILSRCCATQTVFPKEIRRSGKIYLFSTICTLVQYTVNKDRRIKQENYSFISFIAVMYTFCLVFFCIRFSCYLANTSKEYFFAYQPHLLKQFRYITRMKLLTKNCQRIRGGGFLMRRS